VHKRLIVAFIAVTLLAALVSRCQSSDCALQKCRVKATI
jgi:hypothetical protein